MSKGDKGGDTQYYHYLLSGDKKWFQGCARTIREGEKDSTLNIKESTLYSHFTFQSL